MFLHKIPLVFRWLYPSLIWKIKTDQKELYLTFDDGPTPEVTPWVLRTLKEHEALATFFCVGKNIEKHPQIFEDIVAGGHSFGNHSHNHINGWKVSTKKYLQNHKRAQTEIEAYASTDLFRPPYGRISKSQIRELKENRIVMWDVLSGDFSQKLNAKRVLSKSIKATQNGSIIVFHDSLKAFENLKVVLPQFLSYFVKRGYKFKSL